MGRWERGALVSAAIVLALMALAACNGGPGAEPPTASPVPGVTALCQPLAQAERYRYTFTYSVESPQPEGPVDETALGEPPFALQPNSPDLVVSQGFIGTVENPDKLDLTVTTEGAGELRMIFIGPDQWLLQEEQWTKRPAEAVPLPAVNMCDAILSGLDLTGLEPTEDTVDGEKALRYQAEGVTLDTAVKIWSGQSDMGRLLKTYSVTVWLSEEENVPLRMESRTVGSYPSGRELIMEVTLSVKDMNAVDIKVEPPS